MAKFIKTLPAGNFFFSSDFLEHLVAVVLLDRLLHSIGLHPSDDFPNLSSGTIIVTTLSRICRDMVWEVFFIKTDDTAHPAFSWDVAISL